MAPGPTPSLPGSHAASQHPKATPLVQANNRLPQDASATPPAMLPAVSQPTRTNHPPTPDGLEPTPASPVTPTVATTRPPNSRSHPGSVPRALRGLLPHNTPAAVVIG
ncbi:extensin-like [Patiria miniata]|uniref:Uncharacterized protein n=1 Tax=Patiria miniata TaxID=46514 RepID=A0A913ZUW7_PATMI|nr:extensin-like [Patiria miniata]